MDPAVLLGTFSGAGFLLCPPSDPVSEVVSDHEDICDILNELSKCCSWCGSKNSKSFFFLRYLCNLRSSLKKKTTSPNKCLLHISTTRLSLHFKQLLEPKLRSWCRRIRSCMVIISFNARPLQPGNSVTRQVTKVKGLELTAGLWVYDSHVKR